MATITVRKGMPGTHLTKAEFAKRFKDRFFDPDFDEAAPREVSWQNHNGFRKVLSWPPILHP